ncbi:MAG: formyltransferase family protein [Chitinophagaceae bacterium]
MKNQKIIFLGSKPIGYYCLQHLIAQKSALNIDIIGVLTKFNAAFDGEYDISDLAKKNNIPLLNSIHDIPPCDILISVQHHEILKPEHISRAQTAFNLHMAPLPEYRGCNQFSFALLDQKKEFGTTIHIMDTQIDHGDIVAEKRFSIPENCWVEDLYKITFEQSCILFKESLTSIVTNTFQRISQESLINTRGSSLHYRNEINAIKEIDLNWDSEKIQRHIRATFMPGFEPPYAFVNNQKLFFSKTWQKEKK